jgi:hypothetical protein
LALREAPAGTSTSSETWPAGAPAARLWKRLSAGTPAAEARKRFWRLFIGDLRDGIATLLPHLPSRAREPWLLGELGDRAKDSRECAKLLTGWLDGGGDLEQFCELACVHPKGPKLAAVQLADLVVNSWTALDPAATQFIEEAFRLRTPNWHLVCLAFGCRFPRRPYSLDEIDQALARVLPGQADELSLHIRSKTADIADGLALLRKRYAKGPAGSREGPILGACVRAGARRDRHPAHRGRLGVDSRRDRPGHAVARLGTRQRHPP